MLGLLAEGNTMNQDRELQLLRERVQALESLLMEWVDHGWSKDREARSRAACFAGPSDLDVSTRMAKLMLVALKKA